jgi:hypothetical protein
MEGDHWSLVKELIVFEKNRRIKAETRWGSGFSRFHSSQTLERLEPGVSEHENHSFFSDLPSEGG